MVKSGSFSCTGRSDSTNLAIDDDFLWADNIIKVVAEAANADLQNNLNVGTVIEDQASNYKAVVESRLRTLQSSGPEPCDNCENSEEHKDNADSHCGLSSLGRKRVETSAASLWRGLTHVL